MTAAALACCCGASSLKISITRGDLPILSGIAHTEAALQRLNVYMAEHGYELKYDHEFAITPDLIEAQDREKYIVRVYKEPANVDTSREATEQRNMRYPP